MTSFVTIPSDFKRDHFGRPLIIPPGGDKKPVPYRRMTSYIDVLADKYKLQQWDIRQVAIGLAQREDLRLSVLAHLDEKEMVDKACADAKEYARASAAATNGTSFHTLTDIVDAGGTLPTGLPDNIIRTLDAFRAATKPLKVVAIEPKTVLDPFQAAGTPDRIYQYKGRRYIGDTKTGQIRYGTLKIAAQLAGYSRSKLYDTATGDRDHHHADVVRGIIMDVDLVACTAELRWIDLTAGWRAVKVARDVWEQRGLDKFDRLTRPWDDTDGFTTPATKSTRPLGQILGNPTPKPLDERVRSASTREELEAIWRAHQDQWTPDLTDTARRRLEALSSTPSPPTAA